MGCVVNALGEDMGVDLTIVGASENLTLLMKEGKILKKISRSQSS